MYISSIRISNYKCFYSTSELQLHQGFNVVVGPNNVGKSSLIDALTFRFTARPHRSLATLPRPNLEVTLDRQSTAEATFVVSYDEFLDAMRAAHERWVAISNPYTEGLGASVRAEIEAREAVEILGRQSHFDLSVRYSSIYDQSPLHDRLTAGRYPAHGLYEVDRPNGGYCFVKMSVGEDGSFQIGEQVGCNEPISEVGLLAAQYALQFIYHFTADRLHVASCPIGGSDTLLPTAANLAEVILNMSSHRLSRYNEVVREVLPQIRQVSARHTEENMAEVFLWMEAPERDDLCISLTEAGSGVGQVLAMLYVVLNSEHPRVIIIDEPQNFLHPGPVRALIKQFQAQPQNQYIIVTHSPTVISAARPANIITISRSGVASDFKSIDTVESEQFRACLDDLGTTVMDIFGAECVLWVEGPTEAECFRLLSAKVLNETNIDGVAILPVKHTDDLTASKYRDTWLDIYKNLTQGVGVLMPDFRFIFDAEERSLTEQAKLLETSENRTVFLPRRMYENYILHAGAISSVLSRELDALCRWKPFPNGLTTHARYKSSPAEPRSIGLLASTGAGF